MARKNVLHENRLDQRAAHTVLPFRPVALPALAAAIQASRMGKAPSPSRTLPPTPRKDALNS